MAETIKDEIYSILPWPYGCSLSGVFSANLVPIIVIILDSASVRLLIESEIMAIEFASNPAKALNPDKKIYIKNRYVW